MRVFQEKFGKTRDSKEAYLFTLADTQGIKVRITNFGGIITSILMPDRFGVYEDVVLGFRHFEDYFSELYQTSYPYLGAICGRFAGRIKNGRFTVNGSNHQLVQNNGPNHIHGGLEGFDRKLWDFETFESPRESGIKLSYLSIDGEENYPGNLAVKVTYTLNERDELRIEYEAVTDKATPLNLTNHTYFNLSGGKNTVLDHELQLEADEYTVLDEMSIPLGTYKSVSGTPFDFRMPEKLGKRIIELADGYDQNLIIRGDAGVLRKAAILSEKESGRRLEVLTTQPGLQVYSGYYLPEINGRFGRFSGIALETQHFPDSPNHPGFPDTILKPGEVFNERSIFKFSSAF